MPYGITSGAFNPAGLPAAASVAKDDLVAGHDTSLDLAVSMTVEKLFAVTNDAGTPNQATPNSTDKIPLLEGNTLKSINYSQLTTAGGQVAPPRMAHTVRLSSVQNDAQPKLPTRDNQTLFVVPEIAPVLHHYNGSSWAAATIPTAVSVDVSAYAAGIYMVWSYSNSGAVAVETELWTTWYKPATAVVLQDGIPVKTGATTRRLLGCLIIHATGKFHHGGPDNGLIPIQEMPDPELPWNWYNPECGWAPPWQVWQHTKKAVFAKGVGWPIDPVKTAQHTRGSGFYNNSEAAAYARNQGAVAHCFRRPYRYAKVSAYNNGTNPNSIMSGGFGTLFQTNINDGERGSNNAPQVVTAPAGTTGIFYSVYMQACMLYNPINDIFYWWPNSTNTAADQYGMLKWDFSAASGQATCTRIPLSGNFATGTIRGNNNNGNSVDRRGVWCPVNNCLYMPNLFNSGGVFKYNCATDTHNANNIASTSNSDLTFCPVDNCIYFTTTQYGGGTQISVLDPSTDTIATTIQCSSVVDAVFTQCYCPSSKRIYVTGHKYYGSTYEYISRIIVINPATRQIERVINCKNGSSTYVLVYDNHFIQWHPGLDQIMVIGDYRLRNEGTGTYGGAAVNTSTETGAGFMFSPHQGSNDNTTVSSATNVQFHSTQQFELMSMTSGAGEADSDSTAAGSGLTYWTRFKFPGPFQCFYDYMTNQLCLSSQPQNSTLNSYNKWLMWPGI